MWFLCSTCHKTFTKRNNLKRHIRSIHLNITFNCDKCGHSFKRKEYLSRHLKACPRDSASATNQVTPVASTSQWTADDFDLDSFVITPPRPEDSVAPLLAPVCSTMNSGSQTERRKLPPKLYTTHQGTSTSPIFQKDKGIQEKPTMVSTGTSPHLKMLDYYVVPLSSPSPVHSPSSPWMTPQKTRQVLFESNSPIQCYYTSEYTNSFVHNFGTEPPAAVPRWSPEDPLPRPADEYLGNL